MEITLQNVYKCDHCGKKQFRKCDMTRHEKFCKENPNNKHKCFQYCKHLQKSEDEYEGQSHYDAGETFFGVKTVFTCALTKQKMFSYIAERKSLPVVKEEDSIRMPLECEKYKDKNDWGIPEISGFDEDDSDNILPDPNDKDEMFRHEKAQQGWPDDMDEDIWNEHFR